MGSHASLLIRGVAAVRRLVDRGKEESRRTRGRPTHSHHQIQAWKYLSDGRSCDLLIPRATKPDHWESVTEIKLPRVLIAHKPADSGVVVGNAARCCSFQEVTLNTFKQALRADSYIAGKLLPQVFVVAVIAQWPSGRSATTAETNPPSALPVSSAASAPDAPETPKPLAHPAQPCPIPESR